jgi:UMF1 family MFS transporter
MLPPTASTASLFSFYDITEKIGIITGTFLFGFISEISGGMRNAVLLLITLFVMGFLMLLRIRNQRE